LPTERLVRFDLPRLDFICSVHRQFIFPAFSLPDSAGIFLVTA
jgi:hypothetical protein